MSVMLAAALAAAPVGPAARGWQTLARADAEAALTLIVDNHPGAAPALGDTAFQRRLANARDTVARRLPQVRDYGSYSALMLGLANSFGDGHIWSSGKLTPATVNWPGLVSVRRGGVWRVGADLRKIAGQDLTGAQILACDGTPAETLGRERVGGFAADASSEAAMSAKAFTLFLDSGNPWAPPFKGCSFRTTDGRTLDVPIEWRSARVGDVQPHLAAAMHPASAGYGVSDLAGGGKWIALEGLDDAAEAVVADVERRAEAFRAAPLVVVDLRGNGGGDSRYARRLAAALVGEARVAGTDITIGECEGAYWRASEGNLAAVRDLAARRSGEARAMFASLASDMASARTSGQSFTPKLPACASRVGTVPAAPAPLAPSAMKGRLVLLTDRACFSSCLIAADTFRKVGALHVGEATDRSTRYMEVREITLPSGLRTFSTLMKASVGLPDYGPFVPKIAFDGPMDDTAALQKWVLALPR